MVNYSISTENKTGKVDFMTKQDRICNVWKLMLAMVVGVFVSVFSMGAVTVQAAETTVEQTAAEQAPPNGGTEDNGAAMILLMGGMLVIILAVVISVVATFVSSAAIADEL